MFFPQPKSCTIESTSFQSYTWMSLNENVNTTAEYICSMEDKQYAEIIHLYVYVRRMTECLLILIILPKSMCSCKCVRSFSTC